MNETPSYVYRCNLCGFPFDSPNPLPQGTTLGAHPTVQQILGGQPNPPQCTRGAVDPTFQQMHYPMKVPFCPCQVCALAKQIKASMHNPNAGALCSCPTCKARLEQSMGRY